MIDTPETTRHSMHRKITLTSIAILLCVSSVCVAEIPRKTAIALQNRSPEQLTIEVISVVVKRASAQTHNLTYKAKVVKVSQTESNLREGDEITIRYWAYRPGKPVPPGSYPRQMEKGKIYKAYVGPPGRSYQRLADGDKESFFPTAASASFESVEADEA